MSGARMQMLHVSDKLQNTTWPLLHITAQPSGPPRALHAQRNQSLGPSSCSWAGTRTFVAFDTLLF